MARKRFTEAELDAIFGETPSTPTPQEGNHERSETAPKPIPNTGDETLPATEIPDHATGIAEVHESDPQAAPVSSPPPPPEAISVAREADGNDAPPDARILSLPADSIESNPHQPRVDFDPEKLREMADSIREHGILQPILVRRVGADGWQLVAGERRLRSAKIAGFTSIPAIEVQMSDQELLEVALIENLQRDDLNPIEEARAYDSLCRQFGLAHEDVARRVGKNRTTVVNMLRLLRLPQTVKNDLQTRTISTGHARALLGLDSDEQILAAHERILTDELSVRQTEDLVRQMLGTGEAAPRKTRHANVQAPEIEDLQNRLTEAIGVRIRFRPRNETAGRIEIHYANLDELDRVLQKVGVTTEE